MNTVKNFMKKITHSEVDFASILKYVTGKHPEAKHTLNDNTFNTTINGHEVVIQLDTNSHNWECSVDKKYKFIFTDISELDKMLSLHVSKPPNLHDVLRYSKTIITLMAKQG